MAPVDEPVVPGLDCLEDSRDVGNRRSGRTSSRTSVVEPSPASSTGGRGSSASLGTPREACPGSNDLRARAPDVLPLVAAPTLVVHARDNRPYIRLGTGVSSTSTIAGACARRAGQRGSLAAPTVGPARRDRGVRNGFARGRGRRGSRPRHRPRRRRRRIDRTGDRARGPTLERPAGALRGHRDRACSPMATTWSTLQAKAARDVRRAGSGDPW